MIHPHTELRFINDDIGFGVFATQFIPAGAITFVKDHLDVNVGLKKYQKLTPLEKEIVDKYSYIEKNGNRVVSWDHGKYVNHCCSPNTINTGYGFEIAIRDIQASEEMTDDYGLFNVDYPMTVNCGKEGCRRTVRASDLDRYSEVWDQRIKEAMRKLSNTEQPLFFLLSEKTKRELSRFKKDGTYRSVSSLRYQPGSLSSILESTGDALTGLISSTQSIATDAR